jgi:hypothetical protein
MDIQEGTDSQVTVSQQIDSQELAFHPVVGIPQ